MKRSSFSVASGIAALAAVFCISPGLALGSPMGFSDSFEGNTLDPFWGVNLWGGITNPAVYSFSTDQAHSGAQSLKIAFGAGSVPGLFFNHDFATTAQGTFSVWYYDTLVDATAGLYMDDYTAPSGATNWAMLGTSYGDFYSPDWGYYANMPAPGVKVANQSLGWHHLEIIVTNTDSSYLLDGVDLGLVSPLTGVSRLALYGLIPGNASNTGTYVAYFDDFSFTPADSTVPEPATLALLSLGVAGMWYQRRRRVSA